MLTTIMRIQAAVFVAYGLTFFFVPDFTLGTIFDWETMSLFPRTLGATFVAMAWVEWNVASRLSERRDLVWPFVAAPALIFVAFVWEQAAGTYEGSDLFFWVTIALTVFFVLAVGFAATRAE
ncbi:MAG: hypothetical protein ACC658_12780 [Acidimicrobiia bacterium]